jgi:hypothetical protein
MNNLQLYHKVFQQLSQWLPEERVTRLRNGALLIAGLYLSRAVHLSHIVREWPLPGRARRLTPFGCTPGTCSGSPRRAAFTKSFQCVLINYFPPNSVWSTTGTTG